MENLSFALWMIFYPLKTSIIKYLFWNRDRYSKTPATSNAYAITSFIQMIIWIYVANLLYVK